MIEGFAGFVEVGEAQVFRRGENDIQCLLEDVVFSSTSKDWRSFLIQVLVDVLWFGVSEMRGMRSHLSRKSKVEAYVI